MTNPPVSADQHTKPAPDASHPYRKCPGPNGQNLPTISEYVTLILNDNDIRTLHRLLVVEKYRLQNVPIVSLDVGTLQHIIELQDKVDELYPHGEKIPE